MNRGIALCLVVFGAPALAGCFQELDPGASANGPVLATNDGGGVASTAPPDLSKQCATGSAECFDLCGAPSCALVDAAIPTNLGTPAIYEADGATTSNACDQIEAEAVAIRERSCAQCHGPNSAKLGGFAIVMDDTALASAKSQNYTNDAGMPLRLLIPGDPSNSWLYVRMAGGAMPPKDPSSLLGMKLGATVVRPSALDLSVMYGWILNCVGGDGGAYSGYSYGAGPGYGPSGSSGPTDAGRGPG